MEELRDKRGLTEAEAIARYRSRNYPKPALTADILVFRREGTGLKLLLIRRGGHPYLGKLALPGGFANENEPVEATAARELFEETGVEGLQLQLVGIFSAPGRDPRGWVVSAAYLSVVGEEMPAVRAGDDAAAALWYEVVHEGDAVLLRREGETVNADDLAFDHGRILRSALTMLIPCDFPEAVVK